MGNAAVFGSGHASVVGEDAHFLELRCVAARYRCGSAMLFNSSFTPESHLVEHREVSGESRMPTRKYAAYKAADPYFSLVRRALSELVEGEHFFDTVSDDTIYEVLYDLGWPRVIRGRTDLMNAFKDYVSIIHLQSADNLVVHSTDAGRVIVIEYEVHGTVLATGGEYNNRFCSIHPSREPEDLALERLYGLPRSVECIDTAHSLRTDHNEKNLDGCSSGSQTIIGSP